MNNRLGGGVLGTPRRRNSALPRTLWAPIRGLHDDQPFLGYNANDLRWKSAQELIRNLSDIASKGGNYLLNVGPTAEGIIPQPEVDRLLAMGRWLKTNGAAIYGTDAGPYVDRSPGDGRRKKRKTTAV